MKMHPTEDLAAFAIGALDPDDAARVAEHLPGCATCRAEVASFNEVAWGIAELAPAAAPATDLRGRVVERARRAGAPHRQPLRPSGLAALFGIRVPLALPLALAVLLALSLAGLQSARSDADAYGRAVAGIASGTVVTLAATTGSDARGSLVLPAGGEPYLLLRLPAPPPGKTWEAWVIRADRPIPAGTSGARSGVITLVLTEPLRPGDGLAVTLEDAGGVPAPRGAVVLQGKT